MPKLIRNTYAGWVSSNPVLALEDTGFERDTGRSKIGDGVTAWNDLNYFNEVIAGGGSLPSARNFVGTVETLLPANYSAFAVAPTPDRVTLPDVPAGRVIAVSLLAVWAETLSGNGASAALFINGQQIRRALANGAPNVQAAEITGGSGFNRQLSSCPYGLLTNNPSGNFSLEAQGVELLVPTVSGIDDSTHRGAGIPCFVINPPSGEVVVEVRYKVNASRNLVVHNRTLVAWVV